MFKRLIELEHSAFRTRSAPTLSKSMMELQGLIDNTFAEIKSEDLCDLFVQATLTITDPNGLIESALAGIEEKPGDDLAFEAFLGILGSNEASPPIFVLGNVGIGKSTLLHYSFECRLKDKPVFPIFVDFLRLNDDSSQISTFVKKKVDLALSEHLRSYSTGESDLDESIYFFCEPSRKIQFENLSRRDPVLGERAREDAIKRLRDNDNKEDWNRARIHYLQQKLGISVCLIFDNVDHHWTPGFIHNVITEAMAQAHLNQCRLVVTLRDYNYGAAFECRAYAALPFTVVCLDKPELRLLFERRIESVLQKSRGRDFSFFTLSNGYTMKADTYLQMIKLKLDALLTTPVSNLLAGIAGTNFRKLLLCTRYIFSAKVLMAPEETLRSPLTVYDALECILRPSGDMYYEPPEMNSQAVVVNVFEDESPRQPGNCLIRVRVLQSIARYGKRAFHSDVLEDMAHLGYSKQRVEGVLNTLHSVGLIEAGDNSGPVWSIDTTHYCHQLTYCGLYYLESLMYEYRYALAAREATFFSQTAYKAIVGSSVETERSLERRAAEIRAFDDYIDDEEQAEENRCKDSALLEEPFYRIANRLKAEHQNAIRRLRAAGEQRSRGGAGARESSPHNPQGD